MNGSLEPEDRILDEPTITEQLSKLIDTLGWEVKDDIVVELAGTQVLVLMLVKTITRSGNTYWCS